MIEKENDKDSKDECQETELTRKGEQHCTVSCSA